ncbi:MAG: hypothetical protein ABH840_03155 [Nanoarchaeota archaeon]
MKYNNPGFKNERIDDRVLFEGDNMGIEVTPINNYYLTRNQQPKNDGFEIIKSESRAA